jgi:hypothetical protein
MKSSLEKENGKNSKIIRQKLKRYLETIAPSLTINQRKEAKSLMIELGEILKWQS